MMPAKEAIEMNEPTLDTLEIPTLGRQMFLGTLYDCRKDQIILPGVKITDPENASGQVNVCEQRREKLTPIRSDSFDEKSLALGLDASLKASVFCDLVALEGGAEYLKDRQPAHSQSRLTLHFSATQRFEHLTTDLLAESLKTRSLDVFIQGRATHVVTAIVYGSNTFMIFDYCGEDEEKSSEVLNDLEKQIFSNFKDGGSSLEAISGFSNIQCKVHSDLSTEHNPSDIEGIVKLLTDLPDMSGKNAIPIKVWLHPLHKIDSRAARVCSTVSDDISVQAQSFLEGLDRCLIRSNALASDQICTDFPQLKEKLQLFQRLLTEYKFSHQKELARVLPLIRGGSSGEGCIKDMFRDLDSSPFNLKSLNAWICSKRKELSAVRLYKDFLPDVEIVKNRETLDNVLLNPQIENVVCFTFRLKGGEEGYLRALSGYTTEKKCNTYNDVQWYDDMAVLKDMRLKAKLFAEFYTSNRESECTKFIETGFDNVQCSSDEGGQSRLGGSVTLYEEGFLTQEDFQPPSRPLKPQCRVIDQQTVALAWNQPKYGLSNVQRYTVQYKVFRGQIKESAKLHEMDADGSETSVTVNDLQPNQSIQFRVVAVCPAGTSHESDTSGVVTTLPASSPQAPEFHHVTASSVSLEWKQPDKIGKDEIIKSYIIELMVAGVVIDDIDTRSSKVRNDIKNLEPNTVYTFQVVAVYASDIRSPPSVMSDNFTTHPASKPGKPTVSDITSSSVRIRWAEPSTVGMGVELDDYFIQYRPVGDGMKSSNKHADNAQWEQMLIDDDGKERRGFIIQNLKPNVKYTARVTVVCKVKGQKKASMIVSDVSGFFTTHPAGPPTNLTAQQISASMIKVKWSKPDVIGENTDVKCYGIEYSDKKESKVIKKTTDGPSCEFTINEVLPETRYNIKVYGLCGKASQGETSTVECKTRRLLKLHVIKDCQCIQQPNQETGKPAILELPLSVVSDTPQSRSFSFGDVPKSNTEHKVIMVVGVTGSGKSTLINGMVNHILEVEWQDAYRFKIVDVNEAQGNSQAHSQTQVLTSYTLMDENLNLPYTLTIIDTPGFGDTRGIGRDKQIIDQICEFFSDAEAHRIDHIDAIGFVVPASQARLTQTQKYMFDSILSVFGKDIADNILLLVTFADGNPPPVLEAVKEAKIPYTGSMFKFNNSALFAEVGSGYQVRNKTMESKGHDKFDTMFWQMGSVNFKAFFQKMQTLEPRSLLLTKEVLEERKHLEVAVQGLQPQIQKGLCKLEELRREHHILEQHETEIEANKDFNLEDVRKEADLIGKLKKSDYDPFEKYKQTSKMVPVRGYKRRSWLSSPWK